MSEQDRVAHLIEALAKCSREQRESKTKPEPQDFTIAISRQAGALGNSVANEIGKKLGWPTYDQELMKQVADDLQVKVQLLEGRDERPESWLEECIERIGSIPVVSSTTYFKHLMQAVVALGAHGKCIIVGRGAGFVLPHPTTVHVRLVAPLKKRIAVMAKRLAVSEKDAAKHVETTERERNQFIRNYFHIDPTDPSNYDLVLNTEHFSATECSEIIVATLKVMKARRHGK